MENVIEIKANNKQKAIERALKILEITSDKIVAVTEIKKPKSFFGLFAKEGIYKIEADKNMKLKEKAFIESSSNLKYNEKEISNIGKDEILKITQELLNKMELNLKIEKILMEGRHCFINLSGADNGILIGRKGKSLNSFEYLLNTIIRGIKIEVDIEGFKEKRTETLKELAKKMSEKAINTSKPVRLNPMPPKERRIVHEVINQYKELDTYSEGREPKRYIVIIKKR